ncbi:MAG: 6-bladed beta-propeller [Bacteroidales bacterium]|nr:6-bladed beta-propeller [Bacteroidales bacterium]
MNKYSIILLIFLFLTSCANKTNKGVIMESDSVQVLDLNCYLSNNEFHLEDILDSMKIVKLETNDKSLISNPFQIIVTDSRIFIRDDYQGYGVIIFDSNGRFIKRLVHGNGPGEFSRCFSIGIDRYRQELLVLSSPFIMRYDLDGNYISSVETDFPKDNIIGCTKDCYILSKVYGHESKGYDGIDNYSLLVADKEGRLKQMFLPYHSTIISERTFSIEYGDKILIGVSNCDSIFYFKDDSLCYFRKIDISSNKLDISQFKTFEDYIRGYLMNKETTKMSFGGDFFETQSHLILPFVIGKKVYFVFVNKENGHVVSGRYQSRNIAETISITTPCGVFDDWFYTLENVNEYKKGCLTNPKYLNKEDLAKLESLKDDDNPYLVFYKLKQF